MPDLHRGIAAALALSCACAHVARPTPPAAATPAPGAAAALSPVHHDVQVTLVPERGLVLVEDAVTLSPALRARLSDRVVFSLHAGLSPERVGPGEPLGPAPHGPALRDGGEGAEGPSPVPVEHFAVPLAPGERRFTVRYGGPIAHPVEERGEEYARKMAETAGLVSRDGVILSGATRWLPLLSDDLVTFTLDVRVPPGWEAVSQGRRALHERGPGETRVRWDSPQPQEEVDLVAGPYVERTRTTPGGVEVMTFLHEDDPALADRYLAAGVADLGLYDRLLGPYPYAKFALVENFWETGYGMPSFTLLGPRVLRLPFLLRSSFPHEILHDWWGNGVFVDPSRGNWSEGLTAYLADHLFAEADGRGAEYRRTALQRYADYVGENRDSPVRAFRERHDSVTQAIGYDKVLMIFHMLRLRLGDDRFVAALRSFYAGYRFREASFTELAGAMSAAAGEDLAPFFAQWVDRAGAPTLRVEGARLSGEGRSRAVELTLAQTQAGEPFELEVPVFLTLPSSPEAVRRVARLSTARASVSIPIAEAPLRVDVDPEFDVFRRVDPAELAPALSGAFGAARRVLVLPSGAPPALAAAYRALAESWKRAGTEIVSDRDLAAVPLGKSLWVLGWENRLRPLVAEALAPHGVALSDRELRAGRLVLARADRAVAAVARSPADPEQVIAFLGADRAAALPGLARKLPHYGRYGLLGFEGDEPDNVAKETWAPLASPMAVGLAPGGALPARAPLPPRAPLAMPR
ncbi:M1 family metallopeptidase [Anaeromyxobacter oryzisoli]|uniref:M1 family metallopeptidase n=1 Tax=Anaeromyxobacter oryzisoli TaxID=2925408 RepID=UPI001F591279|nr:M1 family aminopeptidase [Anaeromyxobacter sp. SG63]